ncbi:hypothetical protein PYCCODRAFT_506399 [Trametes coccinea BRFM310]|uniref:Uncharacterized protein n=1 Tax=Trametes coccinea (strain BRFM310) TaxID=1353009 RepID=A0A1Y2IL69_TRAC3|nr:hypothetical protein PYCCODRAFT_506399 [Trametes coccinea BRFM310]
MMPPCRPRGSPRLSFSPIPSDRRTRRRITSSVSAFAASPSRASVSTPSPLRHRSRHDSASPSRMPRTSSVPRVCAHEVYAIPLTSPLDFTMRPTRGFCDQYRSAAQCCQRWQVPCLSDAAYRVLACINCGSAPPPSRPSLPQNNKGGLEQTRKFGSLLAPPDELAC